MCDSPSNSTSRRPFAMSATQIGPNAHFLCVDHLLTSMNASTNNNNNEDDDNNNQEYAQQLSHNNSMIVSCSTLCPEESSMNPASLSQRRVPQQEAEALPKPLLGLSPRLAVEYDNNNNHDDDDDDEDDHDGSELDQALSSGADTAGPHLGIRLQPQRWAVSPSKKAASKSSSSEAITHTPSRYLHERSNNRNSKDNNDGCDNDGDTQTAATPSGGDTPSATHTHDRPLLQVESPSCGTSVRTSLSLNAEMLSRSRGHLRTHSGASDHDEGDDADHHDHHRHHHYNSVAVGVDDADDLDGFRSSGNANGFHQHHDHHCQQQHDFLEAPTPSVGGRSKTSGKFAYRAQMLMEFSLNENNNSSKNNIGNGAAGAASSAIPNTSELASTFSSNNNNNVDLFANAALPPSEFYAVAGATASGPPPLAPKRKPRSNTKPPNHAEFRGWETVARSMAEQVEDMMSARQKRYREQKLVAGGSSFNSQRNSRCSHDNNSYYLHNNTMQQQQQQHRDKLHFVGNRFDLDIESNQNNLSGSLNGALALYGEEEEEQQQAEDELEAGREKRTSYIVQDDNLGRSENVANGNPLVNLVKGCSRGSSISATPTSQPLLHRAVRDDNNKHNCNDNSKHEHFKNNSCKLTVLALDDEARGNDDKYEDGDDDDIVLQRSSTTATTSNNNNNDNNNHNRTNNHNNNNGSGDVLSVYRRKSSTTTLSMTPPNDSPPNTDFLNYNNDNDEENGVATATTMMTRSRANSNSIAAANSNIDGHTNDTGISTTSEIVVMSYNILAQRYVTTEKYGEYCSTTALEQGYRVKNVARQIAGAKPHILLMQEVATSLAEEGSQLRELLKDQGLSEMIHVTTTLADGRDRAEAEVAKQKINHKVNQLHNHHHRHDGMKAVTEDCSDGTPTKSSVTKGNIGLIEGVAVSWNPERFELVDRDVVRFNVLVDQVGCFGANEKQLLKKSSHNVANLVALRDLATTTSKKSSIGSGKSRCKAKDHCDENENDDPQQQQQQQQQSDRVDNIIIVACVHIYYDHSRRECQLWHLVKLTEAIEQFKQRLALEHKHSVSSAANIHVILGGDFNCDWNKFPIRFLETGKAVLPTTAFGDDHSLMQSYMAKGGQIFGLNCDHTAAPTTTTTSKNCNNTSNVVSDGRLPTQQQQQQNGDFGSTGGGMFISNSVGGGTNGGISSTEGENSHSNNINNNNNNNNNSNNNSNGTTIYGDSDSNVLRSTPPSGIVAASANSSTTNINNINMSISNFPRARPLSNFSPTDAGGGAGVGGGVSISSEEVMLRNQNFDLSVPPTPAKRMSKKRNNISTAALDHDHYHQNHHDEDNHYHHHHAAALQAPNVLFECARATHQLSFASAYRDYCLKNPTHVSAHDVQTSFAGVIDLIFYQPASFRVTKIGRLMSAIYAIPNNRDPSDHCPVAVTLEPLYK